MLNEETKQCFQVSESGITIRIDAEVYFKNMNFSESHRNTKYHLFASIFVINVYS